MRKKQREREEKRGKEERNEKDSGKTVFFAFVFFSPRKTILQTSSVPPLSNNKVRAPNLVSPSLTQRIEVEKNPIVCLARNERNTKQA
jgi:hypothetical protein